MLRNQLKPCDYGAYIPGRWKYRKGVINEWEDSIQELEDQLMPNQGIFTLERLKHRRMKDGKAVWEEGKAILLKMQGDSLPTRLLIGYGHVWLNVKPYIEAVKQCFKCLRYGHIQMGCRAPERRCFICTKPYHGRCTENPRCCNCKGEHISTARECPHYQKEAAIKKIMAYKNTSYKVAAEMVRREEMNNKYGYDARRAEEEGEENTGNNNFPALRKKSKIEYWERLEYPVEKEIGKLKKAWERNKEHRSYRRGEEESREELQYDDRRPEHNKWGHGRKILINNNEYRQKNSKDDDGCTNRTRRDTGHRGQKEDKRLHFIPRVHDLVNEQEIYPEQNVPANTYKTLYNEKEEERARYEERRRRKENNDTKDRLNKQMEEELLEEIVRIVKEKKLIKKLNLKLNEVEKGEEVPNDTEEEWNGIHRQPYEMFFPKKDRKNKSKSGGKETEETSEPNTEKGEDKDNKGENTEEKIGNDDDKMAERNRETSEAKTNVTGRITGEERRTERKGSGETEEEEMDYTESEFESVGSPEWLEEMETGPGTSDSNMIGDEEEKRGKRESDRAVQDNKRQSRIL